jgi:hypothetical protein
MAQEKHCWLIRQNKTIQQIFERGVYCPSPRASSSSLPSSTDEEDKSEISAEPCCVSLDGCAALFNPTVSQLELHVDLVPTLEGFDYGSVQGAYNLYPVTVSSETLRTGTEEGVEGTTTQRGRRKATSGFVCVVGSHAAYAQLWEERQQKKGYVAPKKHWHVLEPDSPYQAQASIVISPANALVLWRSDLLHKNYGGDYTVEELTPAGQNETTQLSLCLSLSAFLTSLDLPQDRLLACVG